ATLVSSTLSLHDALPISLTWSPDGKRLASASKDLAIEVWDTADLQRGFPLPGAPNMDGALTPDGRRYAGLSEIRTTEGKATRDLDRKSTRLNSQSRFDLV